MSRLTDVGVHLLLAALAGLFAWRILADDTAMGYPAMRVVAAYAVLGVVLTLARAGAGLSPTLAARAEPWYAGATDLGLAALALTLAGIVLTWDGGVRVVAIPLAAIGCWMLWRAARRTRPLQRAPSTTEASRATDRPPLWTILLGFPTGLLVIAIGVALIHDSDSAVGIAWSAGFAVVGVVVLIADTGLLWPSPIAGREPRRLAGFAAVALLGGWCVAVATVIALSRT